MFNVSENVCNARKDYVIYSYNEIEIKKELAYLNIYFSIDNFQSIYFNNSDQIYYIKDYEANAYNQP